MNTDKIEQQLNYIQRKLNERTAISNLSNYANIADKLQHGNMSIEIDSVNKVISFGNGANKVWFNVNSKTLNNIKSIVFNDSHIDGIITSDKIDEANENPENYANHAISADVFIDYTTEAGNKFAAKEHKHKTNEIYKLNDNEEEETLDDLLDGKADINHNHDLTYAALSHTHAINDISNLQTTLDGKASSTHNHDSSYAALNHNHSINDINNLQTTLDGKASSSHNHNTTYAPIVHTHLTTDISQQYEEEETIEENGETVINTITKFKPLDTILSSKSDTTHNHDTIYTKLANIVSQIHSISEQIDSIKIPNVAAIINYCQDFLTAAGIQSNTQLQELIKGKSAFEVWKEQQPAKPEGEPDYTISDFITSLVGQTGPKGPKGDKGDKGDTGLSAFEVWCASNNYDPTTKTFDDFIKDITGEPGQPGQDAKKSWWEYLTSYGLTGVSAAATIASITSVQGELAALQSQIAVIEGQLLAMVGQDSAEALSDAISDVADTSLSLGESASNVFQSIANVFRNLAGNFQTARQGADAAINTIRSSLVAVPI